MNTQHLSTQQQNILKAALKKVNQEPDLKSKEKETLDTLQAAHIQPNLKVVLIASTYQKYTYLWADLDLKPVNLTLWEEKEANQPTN